MKSSTGRKSTLAVLTLVLLSFFVFTGCVNLFNKPPVWSDIPDQTIGKGATVTLDLKSYVSDPENALKSITLKSGSGSISNGVYTWTPTAEGTYTITAVAEDNAGAKAEKSFNVIVNPSATFVLDTSEFNSGPVVEGATVVVKDAEGTVRGSATTDSKGKATVIAWVESEVEELNAFISKPGYAKDVIFGVRLVKDQTYQLTTTLRKAMVGKTTTDVPIDVDVNIYTDSTKATPVDLNNVTSDSIYVVVTATPTEFTEGINVIYSKANGIPGTSFFAGQRLYGSGVSHVEGLVSVKEFSGIIPLVTDVYDHNDNKVEKLLWLNIVRTPAEGVVGYQVKKYTSRYTTNYDLLAYTRRSAVEFYSKPPVEKHVKAANPIDEVNGAPADTNLWVEIRWLTWASAAQSGITTAPKSYNLYRSFDGTNYDLIVTTSSMPYRDSSPLLEVGKETWYAVSAVYDGYEATKTVIGSVTPLPMVQIEYTGPLNGATNVSTDPTFGWEYKGLEAYQPSDSYTTLKYRWDIWLYDETVNDGGYYSLGFVAGGDAYYYSFLTPATSVELKFSDFYWENSIEDYGYYWVDFGIGSPYAYDRLQKNKTYSWGNELLAAQLEYNGLSQEDSSKKFRSIAYSVHTDLVPNLASYALDPEVYNTFTTGSN